MKDLHEKMEVEKTGKLHAVLRLEAVVLVIPLLWGVT